MAAIAYPSVVDAGPRPVRAPARVIPLRPATAPAVYRRRRVVALAAVALVGAVMILLLRAAAGVVWGAPLAPPAAPAAAAVQPAAAVTYVVRPGDTYWSIAVAMHAPGDVRATVDRLVASRHGAPLRAGETITIP